MVPVTGDAGLVDVPGEEEEGAVVGVVERSPVPVVGGDVGSGATGAASISAGGSSALNF